MADDKADKRAQRGKAQSRRPQPQLPTRGVDHSRQYRQATTLLLRFLAPPPLSTRTQRFARALTPGPKFIPGSHRWASAQALKEGNAEAVPIWFDLEPGDVILFDYRLVHRGVENSSSEKVSVLARLWRPSRSSAAAPAGPQHRRPVRQSSAVSPLSPPLTCRCPLLSPPPPPGHLTQSRPLLYRVFSKPWFQDLSNFGGKQLFDAQERGLLAELVRGDDSTLLPTEDPDGLLL